MPPQAPERITPIPVVSGKGATLTRRLPWMQPNSNWLRDVGGKSIAVLGSGDNQVVFALSVWEPR